MPNTEYRFYINEAEVSYDSFMKDYLNTLLDFLIERVILKPKDFGSLFDDKYKIRQFQAMSLSNQRNMMYAMFRSHINKNLDKIKSRIENHEVISMRESGKSYSAIPKEDKESKPIPTSDISKRLSEADLTFFVNGTQVSVAIFSSKLQENFIEDTNDILALDPTVFFKQKEDLIEVRNMSEEDRKELATHISWRLLEEVVSDIISEKEFEATINGVKFTTISNDPFNLNKNKKEKSKLS